MTGPLVGFQLITERKTVHFRHHYIADDEVWNFYGCDIPSFQSVFSGKHLIVGLQGAADQCAEFPIVFDNQDGRSFDFF
ncbi:hypothetical protein D3C86_1573220 [compost metagenome]